MTTEKQEITMFPEEEDITDVEIPTGNQLEMGEKMTEIPGNDDELDVIPQLSKKDAILKLQSYKAHYPEHCKDLPKHLNKLSQDRLNDLLFEIDGKITKNANMKVVNLAFYSITQLVESLITKSTPIDLTGYTENLKVQQEQITEILEELSSQYFAELSTLSSPEMRLALIMGISALTTYQTNLQKLELKRAIAEMSKTREGRQQLEQILNQPETHETQ